jgi:hypothetical protein
MAMRAQPVPRSAAAALPTEAVIFLGIGGSLLVGLAYLPSATALRTRGQILCEELFPLRKATRPPTSCAWPRSVSVWSNCWEWTEAPWPSCIVA